MTFDLSRLDTVQLVPLTPFSADGSHILTDEFAAFAKWQYDSGMRVFIPGAGTGEFHSLSAQEVATCVSTVRSAVGPDAVVIAPIGMGVGHSIEIGKKAIDAGADALLVMSPVHPYLSNSGLRDYFEALMTALPLPFLAYKKGAAPSDQLLLELAQTTGRLVGVKYAVNEVDSVTRFIQTGRGTVGVYCGTAERFAPFFHLAGATGYTSGAGNICPRLTLAMHAALKNGNYPQAMDYLKTIRPIEDYRARSGDSYNIGMLKAAMKLAGRNFGPVRPPQRQLTTTEINEVETLLQPILAAESALAGG
ncbi:MAG: dihydrodipicolinate synthase family protein [Planctomycetota bacterium]|nr:dihydrodipicolinate synthase family protein [Planctomycetota bacterium]